MSPFNFDNFSSSETSKKPPSEASFVVFVSRELREMLSKLTWRESTASEDWGRINGDCDIIDT